MNLIAINTNRELIAQQICASDFFSSEVDQDNFVEEYLNQLIDALEENALFPREENGRHSDWVGGKYSKDNEYLLVKILSTKECISEKKLRTLIEAAIDDAKEIVKNAA